MKRKILFRLAAILCLAWVVLLVIATVVSPYFRIMYDNSTIVEATLEEGSIVVRYDVVFQDERQSLWNTQILGVSGYGPPTLPELIARWKIYLGVDYAIQWPAHENSSRVYAIALWVVVLTLAVLGLAIYSLLRGLRLLRNGGVRGGGGELDFVAS